MDLAIKQLTSVASQAEALTAGVPPLFTAVVASPTLQARRRKLTDYVQSLIGNRAQLKVVETALGMTDNAADTDSTVAGNVRVEIAKRSTTDAQMVSLQQTLAPLIPAGVFQ
jgi:hypothetical protein